EVLGGTARPRRPGRWGARSPPAATGRDVGRRLGWKFRWNWSERTRVSAGSTASRWKNYAHAECTASANPRDRRQRRDPRGFQEDAQRRGDPRRRGVEAGGVEGGAVRTTRGGSGRATDAVRDRFGAPRSRGAGKIARRRSRMP